MASTLDTPILIASDDDSDSDIEILREEKNEDLDVIFISETAPPVPTAVKCEGVKSLPHTLPDTNQDLGDSSSKTVQHSDSNFIQNNTISTRLGFSLNLNERDSTSPLDLSSKKSSDIDFSDSQDSESRSSCDSENSDLEDFLDVSNPALSSPLASKTSVDYSPDIPGKSQPHSSTDAFQLDGSPSFQDSCTNDNINIDCSPKCLDNDTSSVDACWPNVDLSNNTNCGNPSLSLSSSDDPGDLNSSSLAAPTSDVGAIAAPSSDIRVITPHVNLNTVTTTGSQGDSSLQFDCSAPKKLKSSSNSANPFDYDIWDSVKKDLDFLNKASSGFPGMSTSAGPSDTKTKLCSPDLSCPFVSSNYGDFPSTTLPKHTNILPDPLNSPTRNASLSNLSSDVAMGRCILGTSNNSVNISKQLPPKKQIRYLKQASEPIKTSYLDPSSKGAWGSEKCAKCGITLGCRMSRCLQGHATCGLCMEENVKLVLTGKSKETLRCVHGGCDSYYPLSELKQSLPSMVVEILEDKLDNDYIDFVANLIMKNASSASSSVASKKPEDATDMMGMSDGKIGEESIQMSADEMPSKRSSTDENCRLPSDWPSHWSVMDQRMGHKLHELEPESAEYIDVATRFYASLPFPTADILKISRVQNPILWQYFSVKRTEMIQENDGHDVEEKHLFHGTSSSVVEAICKKGFDWRVCGKHGTVYGQGSYFAVHSSYSHQYTDKGNNRRGRIGSMMRTSLSFPMMTPPVYPNLLLGNDMVLYNVLSSNSYGLPTPSSSAQPSPAHSGPCPAHSGPPSHVGAHFRVSSSLSSSSGGISPVSLLKQHPPQSSGPQSNSTASQLTQPPANNQMQSTSAACPQVPNLSLNQRRDFPSASSSQCLTQNSSTVCQKSPSTFSSSNNNNYNQLRQLANVAHRLNTSSQQANKQMSPTAFRPFSQSCTSNQSPQSTSGTDTKSDTSALSGSVSGLLSNSVSSRQMPNNIHRMSIPSRISAMNRSNMAKLARRRVSFRYGEDQEDQEEKTVHKVFMAKVLVGRYTGGSAAMRKPPPLDQVNEPYGKRYDSCVDNIHNPKIFVIFDSTQAYPDYLIEYHCTV